MEREAWLELGERHRRGAGGEGRPVRSRGEPWLRGELGGAQSRGLMSQPRREGGWQRPGGGPGADAEQGRPALRGTGGSKCGRPFFKALMRRKQRLKRSAGGRGRPGRSLGLGRARGEPPGRSQPPAARGAPSGTSSGGRTGCASQLACPRCRGTETAVGKQVSFWQPAQCRGLGTLSPALGLLLLKLVPSVPGTRRPRSAPWG